MISKKHLLIGSCALAVAVCAAPRPADAAMTTCRLDYRVSGWSLFYKSYRGVGMVRCENGQSARIRIETQGGGLTFGKSEIQGHGRFSEVRGIDEVFGTYAHADAHAGVTKSAEGRILTKGQVSLSLSGTGRGVDVGIAFGAFRIKR